MKTTSVTGTSSDPARRRRGFTLIELLVVLVLIGIIVGFATLAIDRDPRGDRLGRAVERLSALLTLAQEQALARGEEWGLLLEPDGYRFMVLDDEDHWQPVTDDPVFRARHFPPGTEVRLELEGRPLVLAADPERQRPSLVLLSSGGLTPFVAEFSATGTERRFRITGRLVDGIRWQEVIGG